MSDSSQPFTDDDVRQVANILAPADVRGYDMIAARRVLEFLTDRGRLIAPVGALACTGLSAQWCPNHGTCRCPDREEAMDGHDCPLHSHTSTHAEETP